MRFQSRELGVKGFADLQPWYDLKRPPLQWRGFRLTHSLTQAWQVTSQRVLRFREQHCVCYDVCSPWPA